jgi:hypothetical protein
MIVGRRCWQTAGLEAMCVVIVMDGDRIARGIVPRRMAKPGCAGADDRREEQRNRARASATKKAQPSHQLNDDTPI